MEYNVVLPTEKDEEVEHAYQVYLSLNNTKRKKLLQKIVGDDFNFVGSMRILPRWIDVKDDGVEARRDDID